ncbi:unnamed protein product [Rhodiola kirilowii]
MWKRWRSSCSKRGRLAMRQAETIGEDDAATTEEVSRSVHTSKLGDFTSRVYVPSLPRQNESR